MQSLLLTDDSLFLLKLLLVLNRTMKDLFILLPHLCLPIFNKSAGVLLTFRTSGANYLGICNSLSGRNLRNAVHCVRLSTKHT